MSGPRIYNPAQLPGDELEQSFVARQETLADLLGTIREQTPDAPCQHTLLIGPRGMGKTTMGLMCLRRIEQDSALAALWQPVRFHEESYGIGDLADLWQTALRHLAHATGESQWAEKADAIVTGERDANRQAAYALAALLDFHQETGKRLLLFIENLDHVLAQIGDERQIHALRAALTQYPELMLLGSANTVFKAIRSHSHPFYEFFRLVFLRGLDADETRILLKAVAGEQTRGRFQDSMVEETGRLETIRRLTGGNPRLLQLACRMIVESPLGTAFEDLERLIDEQTPYFKGRIEELPPQLRRVFHCLAAGWRPLRAKEVAATSKLSSSHASAQLRQLVEKGYAKEHQLPNNKWLRYEVVDRFYNIYYLLRLSHQGRSRFVGLLQFLQELFGAIGMRTLYEAALSELRDGTVEREQRELISVLAEHVAEDRDFAGRAGWMREAAKFAGHTVINVWFGKAHEHFKASRFREAATTFGDVLGYAEEHAAESDTLPLHALVCRVASLGHLGSYEEIVRKEYYHFAETVCANDNDTRRRLGALYFLGAGHAHETLDITAVAVEMWTRCADLIKVRDPPSWQSIAATALFLLARSHAKRKKFSDAVTVTRSALEFDCSDVPATVRRRWSLPLITSAKWLLILCEQEKVEADGKQRVDLAEAEQYARRALECSPMHSLILQVLSDILARQGRWEESLTYLGEAVSYAENESALAIDDLAKSFIWALAAGYATRVKEIMSKTALVESMEPVWHVTCAELGEEVDPLPAEIADAVAVVAAEVETVRGGHSMMRRAVSSVNASTTDPPERRKQG